MYQSRCTAKNSWWWAERLLETCRVVIPVKLEFSASVGFIHKESVTMHGHTFVKVPMKSAPCAQRTEDRENKKDVAGRNGPHSFTSLSLPRMEPSRLVSNRAIRLAGVVCPSCKADYDHDILYPSVSVPLSLFEWCHWILMMVDWYMHVNLWPSLHVTRRYKRLKLIRRR